MMSGDHSRLWPIEKALSVSLLVLVPAAIASPHFILDNLLAVAAVAHFHWYELKNEIIKFDFFL